MTDHAFVAWPTTTRQIAHGNAGNRQTIKAMSELAFRASTDPRVIEAAQNVVRAVPERDDMATFAAVLRDVRARMRYTHDPLGAELVKDPAYVIGMSDSWGIEKEPMDCDDASTLAASMLGALGYRTQFVTVAADPGRPSEWSHVYLRAQRNDGRWVPIDPIVREFGLGQEVPAERLTAPRAYHEGVTPMRMGCDRAMAGLGAEGSWWEQLLATASTGLQARTDTAKAKAAADIAVANAARDSALARARTTQKKTEASIFSFTKADGTTDWTKVSIVAGVVVIGGIVAIKMVRGRRR